MDIQTRKIEFVQKFLRIHSVELISRLEDILSKELKSYENDNLKPMTVEEFNTRIDKSMEDSKKGRLVEQNDLKAKINKWG